MARVRVGQGSRRNCLRAPAHRGWSVTWLAPTSGPVDATISIPGSKSLTNRYLVLAALGGSRVRIHNPLIARDTELMAQALRTLGASVTRDAASWIVEPGPIRGGRVECGLAGTVMRFIPPIAALASEPVVLDGDPAARLRPMNAIVEGLRGLGVRVDAADRDGSPVLPVTINGQGLLAGGRLDIDASASSQFVSALLLAGPLMTEGLDLRHVGARLPSQPHIDMTIDVLRTAGIDVEQVAGQHRWLVRPGVPQLPELTVEPDLSNAGAFLAAAMVTGGTVRIPGWPQRTTQPGDSYRHIFVAMGGRAWLEGDTLHLHGPQAILPYDADMCDVGELVPTVAAVAAFAEGTSRLRNIGQLRGHETDRLSAIVNELAKVGISARVEGDDLVVDGARPCAGATIDSYDDHRMATFGAILGLRLPGTHVINIETTAKTLPEFVPLWTRAFSSEGHL
ncbi:3-phosphoshikimate 1-carboxyvinyltransferase [Trueperella pecoris]|uniref:3-phosphoshikimate 1-carboxyvinyltransferase n=1 Tax=Trueperella pecoris TaxID=2733571 RepID=A0A7M1QVN9_9ACTO|nr:3-phosphoshikimate 1-carboxyvinyltransferase [Trueperella pecoris]